MPTAPHRYALHEVLGEAPEGWTEHSFGGAPGAPPSEFIRHLSHIEPNKELYPAADVLIRTRAGKRHPYFAVWGFREEELGHWENDTENAPSGPWKSPFEGMAMIDDWLDDATLGLGYFPFASRQTIEERRRLYWEKVKAKEERWQAGMDRHRMKRLPPRPSSQRLEMQLTPPYLEAAERTRRAWLDPEYTGEGPYVGMTEEWPKK